MDSRTTDDANESSLNLAELGLSPGPPPRVPPPGAPPRRASVFAPQPRDGVQETKESEENIGRDILGDIQAEGDNDSQGTNESQAGFNQNLQSEGDNDSQGTNNSQEVNIANNNNNSPPSSPPSSSNNSISDSNTQGANSPAQSNTMSDNEEENQGDPPPFNLNFDDNIYEIEEWSDGEEEEIAPVCGGLFKDKDDKLIPWSGTDPDSKHRHFSWNTSAKKWICLNVRGRTGPVGPKMQGPLHIGQFRPTDYKSISRVKDACTKFEGTARFSGNLSPKHENGKPVMTLKTFKDMARTHMIQNGMWDIFSVPDPRPG